MANGMLSGESAYYNEATYCLNGYRKCVLNNRSQNIAEHRAKTLRIVTEPMSMSVHRRKKRVLARRYRQKISTVLPVSGHPFLVSYDR